jgi:hypothetical protein
MRKLGIYCRQYGQALLRAVCRSMKPDTAASSAPTTPPAIVYSATVGHAGAVLPATRAMSQTNEKIHSIGCIGYSQYWQMFA